MREYRATDAVLYLQVVGPHWGVTGANALLNLEPALYQLNMGVLQNNLVETVLDDEKALCITFSILSPEQHEIRNNDLVKLLVMAAKEDLTEMYRGGELLPVTTFAELHEQFDANDLPFKYRDDVLNSLGVERGIDVLNAMQSAINTWLKDEFPFAEVHHPTGSSDESMPEQSQPV